MAALIAATLIGVGLAANVSGSDDGPRGLRAPMAEGMTDDALVVRPVGFAATVVGAAIDVISWPFSELATGSGAGSGRWRWRR